VTHRRTQIDFADVLRDRVAIHFPDAEVIGIGLDHLNTHPFAALYLACEPEEARRIARKLEFQHTPQPASWFNMAELELGILVKPCLSRRIPDTAGLHHETSAWRDTRKGQHATLRWCFNVQAARTKLVRFYP
jgi:hypothetical protein